MPLTTKTKKGTKTVSGVAVFLIISAVIAVGVGIVTLTMLGPTAKLPTVAPSTCMSSAVLDSFDTVTTNTSDPCFVQTTLSSNGTEKILTPLSGCLNQEPAVSVTGSVYLNSAHTLTATSNSVAWKFDSAGLHLKLCDYPYTDNSGSFTVKVQWQKEGTFYTCDPNASTRCQLVTGCPTGQICYQSENSCLLDCYAGRVRYGMKCDSTTACSTVTDTQCASSGKPCYATSNDCVNNAAKDCSASSITTYKCSNYQCSKQTCTVGTAGCYSDLAQCQEGCWSPTATNYYGCGTGGCESCGITKTTSCSGTWDTCQSSSCSTPTNSSPDGCCIYFPNPYTTTKVGGIYTYQECITKGPSLGPRRPKWCGDYTTCNGNTCGTICTEETFSNIRQSLSDRQYTTITEDSFKGWATQDIYDPSGDISEIRGEMASEQRCYLRGDVTVTNSGIKYLDTLMSGELPVAFDYDILELVDKNYIVTGGHATVLTAISKSGSDYSLTFIDPNIDPDGNAIRENVECSPVSFTYYYDKGSGTAYQGDIACFYTGYYREEDGTIKPYTWMIFPEGQNITGSSTDDSAVTAELQAARDAYCASSAGKLNTNFCGRDVASWLESNYPYIENLDDYYDVQGGFCAGWSTFALEVAYLGDFVGECPH